MDSVSEVDVSVLIPPKKRAKKKSLSSSEKHMVLNVYKMKLLHPEQSMSDIVSKTAAATGVGHSSVYRVISEYKAKHYLKSPKKGKVRQKLSESFDDFNTNATRRKVHEFFFHNDLPTIDKVLTVVNEDADLGSFRRTTFYKLLREMNFKCVQHGRYSMLIDRDNIILWRRLYLRTIKQLRDEGRPIYYLDETWLNAGCTRSYVWVDDTINSSKQAFLSGLSTGSKGPSGKGKRLIITHIGSKAGFIEGCFSWSTVTVRQPAKRRQLQSVHQEFSTPPRIK
ncbi:uncharacterized protein LOC126355670 [Schistocerca gregaria]|uniref:uncharacterized protein LOC126355670 n=1 Tax=Schistocerca gregaria TaxID=7010 RepID=UPI00211DCC05|nr:uncharacterized protein LOC126355670 [Schistocerca gregaria]